MKGRESLVSVDEVKVALKNPSVLKTKDNMRIVDDHRWVHAWSDGEGYWKHKPKDLTIVECEQFHELLVEELHRRGLGHKTPIHVLPKRVEKQELAKYELLPDVLKKRTILNRDFQGPMIYLEEVLPYLRSFTIREEPQFPNLQGPIFLTGRLVNEGATCGDIDIFSKSYYEDPRIKEEIKNLFLNPNPPLEPRPDLAERIDVRFDFKGPLVGNSIQVFQPSFRALSFTPQISRREFEVEEEEDFRERKRRMGKEVQKIVLLKPFRPMGIANKALYSMSQFRDEVLPRNLRQAFVDGHLLPLSVEEKFSGAKFVLHKKGNEIKIFSMSGEDRTFALPNIARDLKTLNVENIILDSEVMAYDERGVALPYRVLGEAIHGKEPVDDEFYVAHIFDCLFSGTVDLTKESYERRREYLSRMKDKSHIKKNKFVVVETTSALRREVQRVSKPPSEGAIIKLWEKELSRYLLSKDSRGMWKYKREYEVDAEVVERIPKRYDKGPLRGQVIPNQWVYLCRIGNGDSKKRTLVGKTFASNIKASKGDILRVGIQFLRSVGDNNFHWAIPRVRALMDELEKPDDFDFARWLVKETRWFIPKKREATQQFVGEKIPTQTCPYCHDSAYCILFVRYEYLSDEYLQWLEANPATSPLRFPIVCEYAKEFRCPYPKFYYYSEEPFVFESLEAFAVPLKKVPERGFFQTPYARDGLYFPEPHAEKLWNLKKTMIVKKRRYPQYEHAGTFILGEYAYGILSLEEPEELDASLVRKQFRKEHLISDEEWKKWKFPSSPEKLFVYRPHILRLFRHPYEFYLPIGTQVIVKNVRLREPIKKLTHPSAKAIELEPITESLIEASEEIVEEYLKSQGVSLSAEEWFLLEQKRVYPETPIEEIASRQFSLWVIQQHLIGEYGKRGERGKKRESLVDLPILEGKAHWDFRFQRFDPKTGKALETLEHWDQEGLEYFFIDELGRLRFVPETSEERNEYSDRITHSRRHSRNFRPEFRTQIENRLRKWKSRDLRDIQILDAPNEDFKRYFGVSEELGVGGGWYERETMVCYLNGNTPLGAKDRPAGTTMEHEVAHSVFYEHVLNYREEKDKASREGRTFFKWHHIAKYEEMDEEWKLCCDDLKHVSAYAHDTNSREGFAESLTFMKTYPAQTRYLMKKYPKLNRWFSKIIEETGYNIRKVKED